MTNELGREMTTDEHIAVATGKMTIMDIVHGVALEMDMARDAEIHTVTPAGTVITRGELWREMHQAPLVRAHSGAPTWRSVTELGF